MKEEEEYRLTEDFLNALNDTDCIVLANPNNPTGAPKDKSLLISRMIYILGICDDPKLYTDLNEKGNKQNQLKGYLSRYKHPKYWSF